MAPPLHAPRARTAGPPPPRKLPPAACLEAACSGVSVQLDTSPLGLKPVLLNVRVATCTRRERCGAPMWTSDPCREAAAKGGHVKVQRRPYRPGCDKSGRHPCFLEGIPPLTDLVYLSWGRLLGGQLRHPCFPHDSSPVNATGRCPCCAVRSHVGRKVVEGPRTLSMIFRHQQGVDPARGGLCSPC